MQDVAIDRMFLIKNACTAHHCSTLLKHVSHLHCQLMSPPHRHFGYIGNTHLFVEFFSDDVSIIYE